MKGVLHQQVGRLGGMPTYEGKSAPAVQEFESLAGTEVDLADRQLWRQGGAYAVDQPSRAFDEHYLRTHAQASARIVRFAAEQAHSVGLDDGAVTLLQRRLERCETIATQPLHVATPLTGTA